MKKNKNFWNPRNVVTTFKSILTGLVTSILFLAIPFGIAYWLINIKNMLILGRVIQISAFIVYLYAWGWFANKFWRWS